MEKILTAKNLIDERIPKLTKKCEDLTLRGLKPFMKVILIGSNPASLLYIKNKKKLCEKVGANFELINPSENISQNELLELIKLHNNDPHTTGLFIQLPLPDHLKHLTLAHLVDPLKDVDGFHPLNIYGLYAQNDQENLYPCTPRGIIKLFNFYNIQIASKNIVVIGRSLIVGKPLAALLTNHNATVTLCHSKTKNLKEHTKKADIIISAVGKARYLDASYLGENKKQILIDVGINHDKNNKLCGDIHFENVFHQCQAITPVPGGIGPLTVLSLIENLMIATENQIKLKGK